MVGVLEKSFSVRINHSKLFADRGNHINGIENFSSGAFQSNYELFAFIEGAGIVSDFSALFDADWKTRSEPAPKLNLGRRIISIFSDVIF